MDQNCSFFNYVFSTSSYILTQNYILFLHYVALAAASSPLGVIGGALAGHGVATLVTSILLAASSLDVCVNIILIY